MSSSLLDKSLDAIVDEHKQKSRRTGGRQRNGGAGGPRRQAAGGRSQQRASHQPYSRLGNVGMVGGVGGGASNSSQIIVTNLDYNVTSKDLRDLFSQIGPVTRANLNFDQKGQSKGTADVHFARRNDAVRAVATYNNVTLDGRPMRISVVASADTLLPAASPIIAATNPRSTQSGRRGGGGRSSNFQHRNPQTRQPKGEAASAEQLDAEMDAYMAIDKDNE